MNQLRAGKLSTKRLAAPDSGFFLLDRTRAHRYSLFSRQQFGRELLIGSINPHVSNGHPYFGVRRLLCLGRGESHVAIDDLSV